MSAPVIPAFGAVVLDCPEPAALATFYADLLDWPFEPEPGEDRWVDLYSPDRRLRIAFQKVEGYQPPNWPAQDQAQQFHLDLDVSDLDAGQDHALALGAKLLDDKPARFRVYADPAGHPFCLCLS
ncbi:VOC family protein [Amycolatopsis anabasis]|uniref:VOC family protein n=1 Tax=Amycolatopsis anabasis TaxID=1840409 RepID=UPI00131D24D7|nr:VOC family protein [Amycolatopsis anabasis]